MEDERAETARTQNKGKQREGEEDVDREAITVDTEEVTLTTFLSKYTPFLDRRSFHVAEEMLSSMEAVADMPSGGMKCVICLEDTGAARSGEMLWRLKICGHVAEVVIRPSSTDMEWEDHTGIEKDDEQQTEKWSEEYLSFRSDIVSWFPLSTMDISHQVISSPRRGHIIVRGFAQALEVSVPDFYHILGYEISSGTYALRNKIHMLSALEV
ncbi:hypothetical protein B7494_g7636 [Chlorociboria aeruginascens]|nr:hypothetical protein B7494_g7636 [Chlorociboria aeruginascens]